ncbi:MAG: outer membrane beta-barrel protein [Proteobacteria bacterium]|nr:outer membrane beta-barrel protein [Pseudomonadota bacterium]
MGVHGLVLSLFSIIGLSVTAGSGHAQTKGFYIGAGAGAVLPMESGFSGSGIDSSADLEATASGALSAGYAFKHGLRTEIEAAGRQASVDSVSGSAVGSGDVRVWNLMANVFWDFRNDSDFVPYLGAGAGYALMDFDNVQPVGGSSVNESAGAVAYQGIAGVGYNLTDRFSLFADYRYFGTGEAALQTRANNAVDGDYAEHRVTFGVKWSFSTDPRASSGANRSHPVKPAPASEAALQPEPRAVLKAMQKPQEKREEKENVPEVATDAGTPEAPPQIAAEPRVMPDLKRNYLVFFEFDKTTLAPQDSRGAIYALKAHGFRDITICIQRPDHEVREEVLDCDYVRLREGAVGEARMIVVEHDGSEQPLCDLISETDIIINGTFQNPNCPMMFVTEDEVSCLKPGSLIIDVSCDEGMGFSFATPTSFKNPIIKFEKTDYYAVDHAPSYLWESASRSISAALIVHLPAVMAGRDRWRTNETIRQAINIEDGVIQKPAILAFQNRQPDYPHAYIDAKKPPLSLNFPRLVTEEVE